MKYFPSHFASNHETPAKHQKSSQPKTAKLATLKINSTGSSIVFEGLKFCPTKESESAQAHVKKQRGGNVKANALCARREGEGKKPVCGQRCMDTC